MYDICMTEAGRFIRNLIINTIIAGVMATTSFCLIFFLIKVPEKTRLCDACFATGIFEIAIISIVLLFRTGIFDAGNYTFIKFGELFRRNYKKKYVDAYDYKCRQQEKRAKHKVMFYPYVFVGVVFLIVAIIYEFI